jgi:rhodanese-related sulfurtransferase
MNALRRFLLTASFTFAAAGTCMPAWASDKPPTPTTLQGGKVISVEEAKKLLDGKAAVFVDTRSVVNFGKGHVPGATAAAYKEKSEPVATFDQSVDSFELDKLPKDKNAAIVFYSDGPTGWKSYKAAVLSIKAGHKQVMYMRGGMSDWESKTLPVAR